jgi:hypothetical protein
VNTNKGKILEFPTNRRVISPLAQVNILEQRLGELETENALCLRDKEFINKCLDENEVEMRSIVKELANLRRINV